jgi:hypothetical protein
MRAITPGSSMLEITLSRPPQGRQVSMSMANTRLRRRIQVIPAGLAVAPAAPRRGRTAACGARPGRSGAAGGCAGRTNWILAGTTPSTDRRYARRQRKASLSVLSAAYDPRIGEVDHRMIGSLSIAQLQSDRST